MQCHPIGVVPKKEPGKWRTILHLSYPEGDSVNDFIPKEDFSLSYVMVDTAIAIIKKLGPGSLPSKVDIESAFRLIPVQASDWPLLGMKWHHKFYFDKVLSMGGRSSCFHFNKLPTALEWICQHKCLIEYLIHLLDDFLAIESPDAVPTALATIKQVFKRLGVPLVDHKCVGPTTCLEFLGIILDTLRMEARLSQEKISKLLNMVDHFIGRPKCTKKELLSLIGTFNFAARVVVPGRTFCHG